MKRIKNIELIGSTHTIIIDNLEITFEGLHLEDSFEIREQMIAEETLL